MMFVVLVRIIVRGDVDSRGKNALRIRKQGTEIHTRIREHHIPRNTTFFKSKRFPTMRSPDDV